MIDLKPLYDSVGKNWDDDLKCLLPINILYPELPVFSEKDDLKEIDKILKKYGCIIDKKELKKGDIIVFDMGKVRHFGVYAGKDEFFHTTLNHKLRVSRLEKYKKWLYCCIRRINNG